jgi:hypothetical protein
MYKRGLRCLEEELGVYTSASIRNKQPDQQANELVTGSMNRRDIKLGSGI